MAMAFKTSDISLFMGGAREVLDEVKGHDILYWWSNPSSICSAPSLTYSIFNHKSLSFDARCLLVREVKQNFVLKLGMNAIFVCPIKTVSTDSFLFRQPSFQSSKFLMECGQLIQGVDTLLGFLFDKFT